MSHKWTETLMEYFVLNVSKWRNPEVRELYFFLHSIFLLLIIHSRVLELLLTDLLPPELLCFVILFHPIIYFSLLYSYYFFFTIPSAISFPACLMICFWPHSDFFSLFLVLIMFATSREWQGCVKKIQYASFILHNNCVNKKGTVCISQGQGTQWPVLRGIGCGLFYFE